MKGLWVVRLKRAGFPVTACCGGLNMSCPGFYDWAKTKPPRPKQRGDNYAATGGGSPRMQAQLQRDGNKVGKAKVAQLMKAARLSTKTKKAFRPKTQVRLNKITRLCETSFWSVYLSIDGHRGPSYK